MSQPTALNRDRRPPWHERLRFTARWTWLEWRRRIVRARGAL